MKRKIFIYGTGNMAWALAHGFRSRGVAVAGVCGRSPDSVRELAEAFGLPVLTDLETGTGAGDCVLLAVKDDALSSLNETLRLPGRFVCHTAGSVSLDAIAGISETVGVFYPLQRMQKEAPPDFEGIPVCVEADENDPLEELYALAQRLSGRALRMDSSNRQKAHLAAVFVSNFANFMLVQGAELLKKNGLPPDLLDELLKNLFRQTDLAGAAERQTGPARRGDLKVIHSHLRMLEDTPGQEAIYRLLSFEILKYFNQDLV